MQKNHRSHVKKAAKPNSYRHKIKKNVYKHNPLSNRPAQQTELRNLVEFPLDTQKVQYSLKESKSGILNSSQKAQFTKKYSFSKIAFSSAKKNSEAERSKSQQKQTVNQSGIKAANPTYLNYYNSHRSNFNQSYLSKYSKI